MYFCTGEYPDLFLVDPVDNEPMGAGNAFFIIQNAIFIFENDPFAKTGLGRTDRGKAPLKQRGVRVAQGWRKRRCPLRSCSNASERTAQTQAASPPPSSSHAR